jgi:hypothetical protein
VSTRRAVAVSLFCGGHAVAILWWNLVTLPPPRPTATRGMAVYEAWAAARQQLRGGSLDAVLSGWVRASTTWQQWYLFGPDPPLHTAKLRVYGIRRVGAGVEIDPQPVFELDDVDVDDQRLRLASPPCGFELGDDPRAVYLRGAWTRYVLRERVQATGYVGARLVCSVWPLPDPGAQSGAFEGAAEDIVLWEGAL